ncbi:uncharacterized protein B0T23DRAFT_297789, partial [Neurospora hispaniola]
PIIDRYAAPSSLAALGGPMDHDLWYGSSMSPFGPRQRSSSECMGVLIIIIIIIK